MNRIVILFLGAIIISCAPLRQLPKEKYYAFLYYFERTFQDDSVSFRVQNPLKCPIRVELIENSSHPGLDSLFGNLLLKESEDTILNIFYPNLDDTQRTKYSVWYGDLGKTIEKKPIGLPFPINKEYQVIQGYNGKFSHNALTSKYAIDFNLKIGDTIVSVDHGYVVGVIEDYKKYGTSKKWLKSDKSNFITIYHPHTGLFTQYVHLEYQGSMVELGDYVEKGQPIGICGMTGFTTTPHLHFNVKIPTKEYGLISTPIEFENGLKGEDLTRKMKVKNNAQQ